MISCQYFVVLYKWFLWYLKLLQFNSVQVLARLLGYYIFLNQFKKKQIHKKIMICCKQPFLFKAVKLDKYKQKLFFFTKCATYS